MGINFLPKKVIYITLRSLNYALYIIELSCLGNHTRSTHTHIYIHKEGKIPTENFLYTLNLQIEAN